MVTASIPRASGLVRFSCDKQPHLTEACKVTLNSQEYTLVNIHTDASSLVFTADMTDLTLGGEYPLTFTDCAIATQATITIANGMNVYECLSSVIYHVEIPVPSVVSIEPSLHVFAGETYTYKISFDEPVTLVQAEAIEVTIDEETEVISASSLDSTTIQFTYQVPVEGTAVFVVKKEAVQDDLQRELPENIVFNRIVDSACGPAYLASLSQEAGACRCRVYWRCLLG